MDVTWYGQSCFRLRDRSVSVVCDPYDRRIGLKPPRLTADIVTVSHDHKEHSNTEAVKGEPFIISGPGEYEIKGLFITGVKMAHDAKSGAEHGPNTIYLFDFGEVTVCHLGDLGHVPTQTQVEEIGKVDVLLVPVGGKFTLDAKRAAEVVGLVEPGLVVPMHYELPGLVQELDPLEPFLREMGVKEADRRESLSVSAGQVPQETKVVVLEYRAG
jgi:L-ascorbate metabolism protein UlaG (beta-lactamase superfamily)